MKVALLTDSRLFAGTERHMLDLAGALRADGGDVVIACPRAGALGERATTEGVPVHDFESGGLGALRAIGRLGSALRRRQLDLIHAHNGRTAVLATFACILAGRGSLVTTQHFVHPARTTRRGIKALLVNTLHRWVDSRTCRIIAISNAVRTAMVSRHQALAAKVSVVLNGIRDPLKSELLDPETVREEAGVTAKAPLIVCVCRLEKEKSVHTLIHAVRDILGTSPNAQCLIAGSGEEAGRLQTMIDELGLSSAVRLLGFLKDPLSLMRAADVFVLPSPEEPFGLALVEAMALSRPVVASRSGGPLEIVVQGETGALVTPGCAVEMGAAITELLADSVKRQALGAEGRQRFEQCFAAERMSREIAEIYRMASREDSRVSFVGQAPAFHAESLTTKASERRQ